MLCRCGRAMPISARSRYTFDPDYAARLGVQISRETAVHRLPSATLPSPILTVFAPPRILTIVRRCSEVTGVSANDEKGTGSFWRQHPTDETMKPEQTPRLEHCDRNLMNTRHCARFGHG